MSRTLIVLAILLLLLAPSGAVSGQARGQASVTLAPGDPMHRDVDRLVAWGLVDGTLFGQRPMSRLDVARAAVQAQDRLTGWDGTPAARDAVDATLSRLSRDLAVEIGMARGLRAGLPPAEVVGWSRVEGILLDSPEMPALSAAASQYIDATINPLARFREGRPTPNGAAFEVETTHSAHITPGVLVFLSPRFSVLGPEEGATRGSFQLQRAYLQWVTGNVQLEVGRTSLVTGPSLESGMASSNNALPLDMVKISNEQPFVLPWIFRYLGPAEMNFFFSDLGSDQHFPHTKFYGYKFSFLPWERLEVGLSVAIQGGGEGAPEAEWWEYIADLLIIPDLFKTEGDFTYSNKVVGADFRLRFPEARGLSVYGELQVDDFDHRNVSSSLTQQSSHLLGVSVPRLDGAGRWGLTVEGRHTGVFTYTHSQYASGWTRHQQIMGDPLGTTGLGGYGALRWRPGGASEFELAGAMEQRSNDQYGKDESQPGVPVVKIDDRPEETRLRLTGAWLYRPLSRPLLIRAEAGFESVDAFAFQDGESRTNFLLRLGFEYNPSLR